jgi:hypothetical protein
MYQADVAFLDYSDLCPPRLAVVRFNAVVRFRNLFSSSVSVKFCRRKSITTHLSSIRRVTFIITLYHHMIRNQSQDHDSCKLGLGPALCAALYFLAIAWLLKPPYVASTLVLLSQLGSYILVLLLV